jgi:ribA/ribD-fused uncharacterized protein
MIDRFCAEHNFLSNFYVSSIHYEGEQWQSVEHAFQAMKTLDPVERTQILNAPSGQAAKRIGRAMTLRPGWDMYWRYTVMEELLAIKFAPGSELAGKLLATRPHALVEGNTWHDQVWGDCRCGSASCRAPGMNLLGWMLMRQRDNTNGHARCV